MLGKWQMTVQCEPLILAVSSASSSVKWELEFLLLPYFTRRITWKTSAQLFDKLLQKTH